jgi:outer membrane immunogenic protein
MNIKLLAAAAASLLANAAMAQSAFEGLYGQVGIGYASTSPTTSNVTRTRSTGTTYSGGNVDYGTSGDAVGTITLGYMASITDKFLLGVGVEYSHIDGSWNDATFKAQNGNTNAGQFKMTNQYNIFLSPAYAVDKDKLVYAKVGYTQANMAVDFPGNDSSHTPSGYSLGLGYKQIFTGGWYGFVEGNYYSYSDQKFSNNGTTVNGTPYAQSLDISSNDYNIMVGVGYKF